MVDIINILPIAFMKDFSKYNNKHMLFSHLVKDKEYVRLCKDLSGEKIIDNSWWELRRNLPINVLLSRAYKVDADILVLPDYIFSDKLFIKKIENCIEKVKKFGYYIKLMGVVKGNNFSEELDCFKYFNENPDIDIIAVPYPVRKWDEWRRKDFMYMIDKNIKKVKKSVHLFGINNLLTLKDELRPYVVSADTTMAFKCGYYEKTLPLHPEEDPSRPYNYFNIKRITKRQKLYIQYNLRWMKHAYF